MQPMNHVDSFFGFMGGLTVTAVTVWTHVGNIGQVAVTAFVGTAVSFFTSKLLRKYFKTDTEK
jgi:hypothetical protein